MNSSCQIHVVVMIRNEFFRNIGKEGQVEDVADFKISLQNKVQLIANITYH